MAARKSLAKQARLAHLEKAVLGTPSSSKVSRSDVFEALWKDPKYLRLHERKDKLAKLWNQADAYKNSPGGSPEKAAQLDRIYRAAMRRVTAYEDKALKAAGHGSSSYG